MVVIEAALATISPWFVVMPSLLDAISLMLVVILAVLELMPVSPEPSPTKVVADMVPVADIDPEVIVPVKVGLFENTVEPVPVSSLSALANPSELVNKSCLLEAFDAASISLIADTKSDLSVVVKLDNVPMSKVLLAIPLISWSPELVPLIPDSFVCSSVV